jgi:chemotaxis protein methyltransferase CheR
MSTELKDLTRRDYEAICRLVYVQSGINLGHQKMQLVRARLGKLIRRGGFASYRAYLDYVEQDPSGEELCRLLDAISTNTTRLFREERHFHLLRDLVEAWVGDKAWRMKNDSLRLWSAGCSSGEEPYSLAMTADAALAGHPDVELKVLATDLSVQMLSRAKLGIFDLHRVGAVPSPLKQRYLRRVLQDGSTMMQIVPELRRVVRFARFNLMEPAFPFRHGFHVICCRNVMIYFDRSTQQELVGKFATALARGGYLLIGHSESLSNIQHTLKYVEPAVYRKD